MRLSCFGVLAFALSCLLAPQASAQESEWNWVFPVSNTILDVKILDGSTAIAVGRSGTILKTKDKGTTWESLKSGTRRTLRAVSFADTEFGMVFGDGGTLLVTRNCGKTWESGETAFGGTLRGGVLTGPDIGIAVGDSGAIFRTVDGGTIWDRIPSPTGLTLNGVYNFGNWAFAVGDSGIGISSSDLGQTWTPLPIDTDCPIWAGAMFDTTGWWGVGGGGKVFRTVDGGTTWKPQNSGVPFDLWNIALDDSLGAIAIGDSGTFITTTDGGATWNSNPLDPLCNNFALALDDSFGVAAGSHGKFWTSGGFGKPFNPFPRPPLYQFTDFEILNPDTFIAVTIAGEILSTFNGGIDFSLALATNFELQAICRSGENDWWAAGGTFGDSARVFHSGDGGATWAPQFVPSSLKFFDICFKDSLNGMAVGLLGTIFCTTDGGKTWRKKNGQTNEWLLSIDIVDDTTAFAVGGNGTMIRSRDFGETWSPLPSGTSEWLTNVTFLDDSIGIACGNNATLIRTDDGGEEWDAFELDLGRFGGLDPPDFQGVYFFDEFESFREPAPARPGSNSGGGNLVATVVGHLGTILHSVDGGLTWTQEDSKTNNSLSAVSYANAETAVVVGDFGTVLRRTSSGPTTSVEWQPRAQAPQSVVLHQNYPNPFNPSTTIRFELRDDTAVDLRIFNLRGQLVKTILSDRLNAGAHSRVWDGQDASGRPAASGLYIARLRAGENVTQRKMLLIK